jgi:hypothetical protein
LNVDRERLPRRGDAFEAESFETAANRVELDKRARVAEGSAR